jgi:hypothetical protein
MVRFVGCDVHKRTAVFTVLLADGTVQAIHSVIVTREALAHFAELHLTGEDRLARAGRAVAGRLFAYGLAAGAGHAAIAAADASPCRAGQRPHTAEEPPALDPASLPGSTAALRSVKQSGQDMVAGTPPAGAGSRGAEQRPASFGAHRAGDRTGGPVAGAGGLAGRKGPPADEYSGASTTRWPRPV